MVIFHPPQAEPRRQKIGKTEFIVCSYYCGFESIYQRLANLMECELEAQEEASKFTENSLGLPIDNGTA